MRASEEFLKKLPEFTSETFLEFLLKFYKENDISGNFSKKPVFDDKHIDLYRFFCEVIRSGGLEQVHTKRIWRQVAKDSGLPDIPTLPPLLSRWYKSWLQPLEQLRVFPPGHPKHTGIHANFSLKKRKKDTLNSPGSTPGPGGIERSFSVSADSSKRMKMYSPLTNGALSANASPAHHTPPPPSQLMQGVGIPPPMNMSASLSSLPTLPTNGLASTPTRPASQIAMGGTSNTQSPVTPKPAQPIAQQSDVQVLTIPAPPPGPKPLNWFPLERTVDTWGGVDLHSAAMCRPRLRLPNLGDYGSIDIRALTLSIESGITMEVTNALNTLIQATAHPDTVLPLRQCDELAEALFDIIESIKLPFAPTERKSAEPGQEQEQEQKQKQGQKATVQGTYSADTQLFTDSYDGAVDEGGMIGDDIQDETSLRGLLLGGDDLWSFTSNRALTVIYVLRNLSFLHANQQYFADNAEFASMFASLVQKCRRAVDGVRQQLSDGNASPRLASLVVWRAVEFRKSLLLILSNIATMVNLKANGGEFLQATMELLAYFVDEQQTSDLSEDWLRDCAPVVMGDPLFGIAHVKALDGHTYYLLALESAARLTTIDVNRQVLAGKVDSDHYMTLAMACAGVLSGHQTSMMVYPGSGQNCSDKRLMWLQYALVVLSNLVTIATPQPLVASRKYTRFWITENGRTNPSLAGSGSTTNGTQQLQQQIQQQQRAAAKRPMPFVPMTYAAMAVPAEMKRFRLELATNTSLVRALLEIVLLWWTRIGVPCSRGPTPQVSDSPFNEMAERAMHVLQMLHPEHDALFAARWREWVIGCTTNTSISPMLAEVLYELVGLIPVQSAGQLQGGAHPDIC
ncbi:hypothetical protein FBU59_001375 [Linderina macrospora]|uniref:Uncharacterized protein n=1 Tax=Linderina macrospora TaxID=4868 RepID=A0ACC1JE93_9FUNG|nr:hypothetical protein FBU59_001375 [Linderina macrospora]